nr:immunoglobulin light chain junction region [Macaca mulatta]
CLQYSDNSFTF